MAAGDALARGAKSATFPSLSHISIEKWEAAFGKRPLNISKKEKNVSKESRRKNSKER